MRRQELLTRNRKSVDRGIWEGDEANAIAADLKLHEHDDWFLLRES